VAWAESRVGYEVFRGSILMSLSTGSKSRNLGCDPGRSGWMREGGGLGSTRVRRCTSALLTFANA